MRGRDLAMPLIVAVAVISFVGYLWFQGRTERVDFAVTSSRLEFVRVDHPLVPEPLREETDSSRALVVDVTWEAAQSIGGGSYYVLTAVPQGWEPLGCEPECDLDTTPALQDYAREVLPVATFPDGAKFDAEETARVRVVFVPTDPDQEPDASFPLSAWLVQTDGSNVLGNARIQ